MLPDKSEDVRKIGLAQIQAARKRTRADGLQSIREYHLFKKSISLQIARRYFGHAPRDNEQPLIINKALISDKSPVVHS